MKHLLTSAAAFCLMATSALSDGISITDAYARTSSPIAKSGAAFMHIANTGETPDRLISVASDIAARVELHTHREIADGVMKMMEVEEGFEIPAGGMHMLARGGDHVMFMGLTQSLEQDAVVTVTLTFEKAGPIEVKIPVDNARKATQAKEHKHDDDHDHKHDH